MATHTFATPILVGDLVNSITVDKLELVSVSMNFSQDHPNPTFSCVLRHPDTGWHHTVTLTGKDGNAKWAAIKAAFPKFEQTILAMLAEHLPDGTQE